jgi:CRISPR/Cas system-associated exonuclease Cas4 (RecB family)
MPYEVVPPTLREHLSFSQLAMAANCGEAYRRAYVEGEERASWNLPALYGSAFHAMLEVFELALHRLTLAEISSSFDLLAEVMSKRVTREVDREMARLGLAESEVRTYGKQGFEFWRDNKIHVLTRSYLSQRQSELERGWGWWNDDPREAIEFECLVDVGGGKFIARIDQLLVDGSGRTVIRDIKTGKPKAGHAMQLEQYRVALERAAGVKADYGQLLYIGSEKPHPQVVVWRLTDRDVDLATGRQKRAIDEDIWLVNGPYNGACEFCDFRSTCPWGEVKVRGSS